MLKMGKGPCVCKNSHVFTHLHFIAPISLVIVHRPNSETCDTLKVNSDGERDASPLTQLHGQWDLHLPRGEEGYDQLKRILQCRSQTPMWMY